uniref:Putative pancreatic lipase-like enzyme n=1 Tax=Panstrongylus lignarius TaxID=156445 RepID=A0A224XS44_9HEMI
MWKTYGVIGVFIYFSCFVLVRGKIIEDVFSSELELPENLIFKKEANVSSEIKFFLYTRKNPLMHEEFLLDNFLFLKSTNFNASKPIKILIHGWKCFYGSAFNVLVKNAYLTQYDVNVIVVDWSKYSQLLYPYSRYLIVDIAEVIAKLVDKLCDEFGIDPDNIHIVGHSLGAHLAGIVGLKTARKLSRVTGLDPAGPYFSISNIERISPNSAKFVDIIHTGGRFAGFYGRLGHVDFYPNGGTAIQPGCGWDILTLRSHRRAYWLFAESITTPEGFSAELCDSWHHFKKNICEKGNKTVMGEHVSPSARGTYYLRTNYETPFALETLEKINSNK